MAVLLPLLLCPTLPTALPMTSEASVIAFLNSCENAEFLERAQGVLSSRLAQLGAPPPPARRDAPGVPGGEAKTAIDPDGKEWSITSTGDTPAAAAAPVKERDSTMVMVMKEIVATEVAYHSDLRTMISLFAAPLKSRQILSSAHYSALFSNVEVLYDLSTRMLKDIKDKEATDGALTPRLIGTVFKQYAPFLKMYVQYVSNYDQKVQATLEALKVRVKGIMRVLVLCVSARVL